MLESPLEKKAGINYGPPGTKQLIYFVDDLNMPKLDLYETAMPISLVRQHLGWGHWFDRNKLTPKNINNTQYVACMNPTAGSFIINPRLQRLFMTLAVDFPGQDSLMKIYGTFLQVRSTLWGVRGMAGRWVQQGLERGRSHAVPPALYAWLQKSSVAVSSSLLYVCCAAPRRAT